MSSSSTVWATLSGPVPAGRVIIPAGQESITITYANALTSSIIHCQIETVDATLTRVIPVPSNGSFTLTGNANATGPVTVTYLVFNIGTNPTGGPWC